MEEIKHCFCSGCKEYVLPGGIYSHYYDNHLGFTWNDHAFAYSDMKKMESLVLWAKEIRVKKAEE
jgi:hypothetical protein